MKYIPIVAGALLGLLFVASGAVVLLKLAPMPPLPEGSPAAHFMAAFVPTGYLTFVKVLEVIGGILVAIPRTRALGLLTLGPIIVNILAYHIFVMGGEGLFSIPILIMAALALYLLWVERDAFGALLKRRQKASSETRATAA
jgi:putative oxidoreductase